MQCVLPRVFLAVGSAPRTEAQRAWVFLAQVGASAGILAVMQARRHEGMRFAQGRIRHVVVAEHASRADWGLRMVASDR